MRTAKFNKVTLKIFNCSSYYTVTDVELKIGERILKLSNSGRISRDAFDFIETIFENKEVEALNKLYDFYRTKFDDPYYDRGYFSLTHESLHELVNKLKEYNFSNTTIRSITDWLDYRSKYDPEDKIGDLFYSDLKLSFEVE